MTRRRIRAYLVIIAASLWSIWLIDMSRPGPVDRLGKVKGTDFIHFYVIGSIARDGAWSELFDARAQYARTQRIVDPPPIYLPIESPQTALAIAPFTALDYTPAFLLWTAAIIAAGAGSWWLLWRDCTGLHRYRFETAAAAAAFPGLFSVVLHGQTSCAALACVALALAAFRRGRPFAAGLAVGCLVFKPHWAVAAGVVLLFAGEWRAVAGCVVGAAAQTLATGVGVGMAVMTNYARALTTLPRIAGLLEPRAGDSLRGLMQLLVPFEPVALALYAAASLATVIIAAQIWKSDAAFELRASAWIVAAVLVSPHANAYDLVLVGPALMLMMSWVLSDTRDTNERTMQTLLTVLGILFAAPLLTGIPSLIRLQFSVTAMSALLVVIRAVVLDRSAKAFALRPTVA